MKLYSSHTEQLWYNRTS